jgi:cell division protein FtsB
METFFNFGSFLLLLAIVFTVVFLGVTGRFGTMTSTSTDKQLLAVQEENAQLIKDNNDLKADNQGLHHTVRVLSQSGADTTHRLVQAEARAASTQTALESLERRNAVLEAVAESFWTSKMPVMPTNRLRETLITLFTEEELKVLCADLNIDYEALSGTTKVGRAQALIDHCEHRGPAVTQSLIAAVRKLRPATTV